MIIYNKNENGQPIDENGNVVILKGSLIVTNTNVFFFETPEEFLIFKNQNINNEKNLITENLNEIEKLIDGIVDDKLKELWYRSFGEVALIASDQTSIWNLEAKRFVEWYNKLYESFDIYKMNVNLNNIQNPLDFIETLENF